MKNKKIVLVDLDGVIADFENGFLNAWRKKYPQRTFIPINERKNLKVIDDYPYNLAMEVQNIYEQPGFFLSLPMIKEAKESLESMIDLGFKVFICSSPILNYIHCTPEKYAWVENNLGSDWIKKIILTKDKTLIRGNYLIDDWPSKKIGVINPSWELLLFDQPYNQQVKDTRRINWINWKQVLQNN